MNDIQIRPAGSGAAKALILGGGFAGLWAACRLQELGYDVELLEKRRHAGGLLRTFRMEGFYFDLGPHILVDSHLARYRDLLGEEILPVRGHYGFGIRGKEVRSPVSPLNLVWTLGLRAAFPMTLDLIVERWKAGFRRHTPDNVDELLTARFGERINRDFFRDYIPKVTGQPSRNVSPDWFTERHRFYAQHNLWKQSLGKGLSWLRASVTRQGDTDGGLLVYYPRGGAQVLANALLDRVCRAGARVRLGAEVTDVNIRKDRPILVTYQTEEGRQEQTEGDWVVSTLPVTELIGMMGPSPDEDVLEAAQGLAFRNLALFFIVIRRERLSDKIQTYFPEKKYCFKRIYEPKNLDGSMQPGSRTGVCVEVCFGMEEDPPGSLLENLYLQVMDGLRDFYGLGEEEVESVAAEVVPYAYAIYRKGYESDLLTLARFLVQHDRLISYGRQGSFRYNHLVDRVIDSCDAVLRFILSGRSKIDFLEGGKAKADFF